MSKSNAKKLVDKLSKDKKFRDELLAEEAKVALKFAKKAGLECTAEELKEIYGSSKEGDFELIHLSSMGAPGAGLGIKQKIDANLKQ